MFLGIMGRCIWLREILEKGVLRLGERLAKNGSRCRPYAKTRNLESCVLLNHSA